MNETTKISFYQKSRYTTTTIIFIWKIQTHQQHSLNIFSIFQWMTFSLVSDCFQLEEGQEPIESKREQEEANGGRGWTRVGEGVARGGREARNVSCIANRGFNKPPWIPDDAPLWRSQPDPEVPYPPPSPFHTPVLSTSLGPISLGSLSISLCLGCLRAKMSCANWEGAVNPSTPSRTLGF